MRCAVSAAHGMNCADLVPWPEKTYGWMCVCHVSAE